MSFDDTSPFSSGRLVSLACAGALVAAALAGCASSSPDIPEESKSAQYESTKGANDSESSTASSGSNSGSTTGSSQNRKLTTATKPGGTTSSGNKDSLPKATGPVAHVNGDPIPAEKFNDQINKLSKSGQMGPRRLRQATPKLIDKLIEQRLVEDYIDEHDVSISDKRIDKKLKEVREEFRRANKASAGQIKTLEDARAQMGISDKELRDSIRQSLAIEEILTSERGVKLPTDDEVRTFYDNNKRRFQRPERVKISHILFKVPQDKQKSDKAWKKAKKRARKIHKKAKKKGADFAALAKKHSEGPTAKKGGDLGYVSRRGMRGLGEITDTAFNMKNGEVSEPVKSRFGWHIIKRVDHKSAGVVPFQKVEDKIRKQLKNRKLKKELRSLVKDLRDRAKIRKHPENVE